MRAFDTPVLLLVFNRPDETAGVFESIRNTAPKHLYIAADGPRKFKTGEAELCERVKQIVAEIDWDCQVHTLYREENLGCGIAVSTAITWFFEQVEYGIILEDDTLPHSSFFSYCQEILNFYKDDHTVMHISGTQYARSVRRSSGFYFTRLPFIWGWATWRRAWAKYDYNYKDLPFEEKLRILHKTFSNTDILDYWSHVFSDFHLKPKSFTWDYQWLLSVWDNDGLVVQPEVNLVRNIGFSPDATHTKEVDHHLVNVKAGQIDKLHFTQPKEVDIRLQNENFYFYFANKPRDIMRAISENRLGLSFVRRSARWLIEKAMIKMFPELSKVKDQRICWDYLRSGTHNCQLADNIRLNQPYRICDSTIDEYTYLAFNSTVYRTEIGKFCSIGPNLFCGYGIHPTDGLSTSPMFYSTRKQNGCTFSASDKLVETKRIKIGNDVFIGANVTILDGVTIGDGAVIGAGSVVSKDIPPYAIAVGSPIRIVKYRFGEAQIEALLKIRWWDFGIQGLYDVERDFFEVDMFIKKHVEV